MSYKKAAEQRVEEAYARFLEAVDAVDMSERQRAAIYNAALDWHGANERLALHVHEWDMTDEQAAFFERGSAIGVLDRAVKETG